MDGDARRPFYDEYAWAYDFVIPAPAESALDFVAETFARRGVVAGSRVLDAGCGTGRHAVGLARRGYAVEGVDTSPGLVAEARARAERSGVTEGTGLAVSFGVGDILDLRAGESFDAILCRGVLNDLTEESERGRVFGSFAGALRRGGVLLFDVREWESSVERKTREPVFEMTAETPRGTLTFRSVTTVDTATRRLLVGERHTLRAGGVESVSTYDFAMRCWTREELEARLSRAGFGRFEFFGGYDAGARAGSSDRLVCACERA